MKIKLFKFMIPACLVSVVCSCGGGLNVEEEYNKIVEETNGKLAVVQDSMSLGTPSYLGTSILDIKKQYDSSIDGLKGKIGDNKEKIALLDSLNQGIDSLPQFKASLIALEAKNTEILDSIRYKGWIIDSKEDEDAEIPFIFMVTNDGIRCYNYKNNIEYSFKDGSVYIPQNDMFLYFDTTDSTLILKNQDGNSQKYNRATDSQLLIGDWSCSTSSFAANLEKNGNIEFTHSTPFDEGAYSVKGNKVTFSLRQYTYLGGERCYIPSYAYGTYNVEQDNFNLTSYRIESFGVDTGSCLHKFTRKTENGPSSPTILFGYSNKVDEYE